MTFEEVLDQALAMLQRRRRVTYRTLQLQFQLDDDTLDALKEALLYAHAQVVDDAGHGLVWAADTPVTPPPVTAPRATSLPSMPERRQLTVMFCDLVDSTTLASRLDPEEWREVVRAYHTVCAEAIARFGGEIAQYLGDGLLVYFGYPIAHEDDPSRAIQAGLALLNALDDLNVLLAATPGVSLALRLGMHTGLVVIGEMGAGGRHETLALGETPNIAARLQALAAPNTLVISATTYRLVQGYFACDDLGMHALKGLGTPLQVYRVRSASGVQSRLEVAATHGLTPLVGREQEMGLLLERWQQAADGHGQVVLLSGEAGIGKSRLVEALCEELAPAGYRRTTLRCSPYMQHSALSPLIDAMQRQLAWSHHETPAEKAARLEQALQAWRLPVAETLPLFAAMLGVPLPEPATPVPWEPQAQKQLTHAALVAWLLADAETHPVLTVWEDVHWADPSSLEVLHRCLDQVPTTRQLILVTARPEFQPFWAARSYLTVLPLARLTGAHVIQLVRSVPGGQQLAPAVVEQIVTKTDGVPLFVEELTKTVVESEELGQAEAYATRPTLPIPATLHDSLMARLDRLVTAKGIAQLGAVIGRQFSYDLLQVVSRLDDATLQRELGRLVAAELLYQRGVPPHAIYTFKHALVQDVAYQSLLKRTRQQYHQQIAQAVAMHWPEMAAVQPELLAHHYTAAGLLPEAVEAWYQSGQRADRRAAHAEAVAHFSAALDILPTLPETSERAHRAIALYTALGWSLQAAKGYTAPEAEHAYTQALTLCQRIDEMPPRVPVLLGLWAGRVVQGALPSAQEVSEHLLWLASRVSDTPVPMLAHMTLGFTLFHRGDLHRARAHLEQSLALYASQRPSTLLPPIGGAQDAKMLCLSYMARLLWLLGYPAQAAQRSQEALAHAQALGHPLTLLYALAQGAMVYRWRGEMPQAQEHVAAARTLAIAQGVASLAASRTFYQGLWLMTHDQEHEGRAQVQEGLAAYRATGARLEVPYMLGQLAEAYGSLSQSAAALAALAEALELVAATGECWWEAELYRLKGLLLLTHDGPQDTAEHCFQKALEIARAQQAQSLALRAALSLGRLWQQQGKGEAARRVLAEVYDWFTEGFDTADVQHAGTFLAAF